MGTDADAEHAFIAAALDRYEGPLLRYAASLVGSAAAADVVQDTILALCRTGRERIAGLAPWLFTVCRNRALDCVREGRRLQPLEQDELRSPDTEPGQQAEAQQALERVEALLVTLTDKQRQVVLLKFSGGLSYKEIAEVMALSVSHVGVLLHTAIGRLRARLVEPAGILSLGGEA